MFNKRIVPGDKTPNAINQNDDLKSAPSGGKNDKEVAIKTPAEAQVQPNESPVSEKA